MSYIRGLRQQKAALITQAQSILRPAETENRPLTAEETQQLDALQTQAETLAASIERAERLADIARDATPPTGQEPASGSPGFKSFGEQLQAVAKAGRMGGGMVDPRLMQAASGLSEGVPADGGFLIQPDFATEILRKTYASGNIISRVRKLPLSANTNQIKINAIKENSRANGSRWGGVLVYWADEAATATAGRPQFRQIELNLKKLIGICYATDELLRDAAALESVISTAFSEEMTFKVEDGILNGTGGGQLLGLMNGGSLVTQAIESTQTIANSGQFLITNVTKMWSRLFAPCQANAVWLINQEIIPYLYTMTLGGTAASQPVFLPPMGNQGGAVGAPSGTLYGRPIIAVEQTQAVGTPGDILLTDLTQYLLADQSQGVLAASSIHVRFLYDEMTYRFVFRTDGSPAWNSPLTPFKGSNTQSPFVALAARS